MQVKSKGRENLEKWIPVILLVVYFCMLMSFVNDTWFESDELDIMINGQDIAKGRLLYRDIVSQHMPFTYYISALFYLAGARTVTLQRIAFYILIAGLWVVLYCRNKDMQGKAVMAVYPLIFCCMIQTYDMGTQVLSEQLAAVGMVMLLLEYLRYVRTKEIDWKTGVYVSIAVILTFGTLFIAAFPVFVIALGVFAKEIVSVKNIHELLVRAKNKYLQLFGIIAVPWIVLLGYYLITGTLKDFIYGAYEFNREVYPRYVGFGAGILSTLIDSISNAISQVMSIYTGWNAESGNDKVIQVIGLCCIVLFVILVSKTYDLLTGVVVSIFIVYTGTRGYYNFHGTQFVGVAAFVTSWVLIWAIDTKKICKKSVVANFVTVLVCISMLGGYMKNAERFYNIHISEEKDYDTKVVETITDDDEMIWMTVLNNHIPMQAKRVSMARGITTPWTWEGFGAHDFAEVQSVKPRVVVYYLDYSVWNYEQKDYASDAVEYIEDNYTQIEGTGMVWVRNDYYDEACKKIESIQ